MPTPEQQHATEPEALEGMPGAQQPEQQEQRYKTIAVRVEEQLHSQLQFIAQLDGTSISEEIRTAIQSRIDTAQDDPELVERAQKVREQIEREAAARTAAIAGFMGQNTVGSTVKKPKSTPRGRNTKTTNQ